MSRQSGFALLVVTVSIAVLGAVVSEFGYNARVEMEAAANARDQLRAEYLARSGINLARLLVKVQGSVLDPINQMGTDFQITEFAPFLLRAFGGGNDERQGLTDLLGIDSSAIKGLGNGKDGSFDVVMGVEDGKININCGGGFQVSAAQGQVPLVPGQPPPIAATSAQFLYQELMSTMAPLRYNRLFESQTADGQFVTRDEVARAIVDWTDVDESRFEPNGPSSASEDYRYESLRDPYKAHNNFFDTVEELNLVRGVGDDFWGSFGELFTVYGRCKLNIRAVSPQNWPVTAALIRASAIDPSDPVLMDDTVVAALAQQLSVIMQIPSMLTNTAQIVQSLGGGATIPGMGGAGASAAAAVVSLPFPGLPGVKISKQKLEALAKTGPREIYRLDSTGTVRRAGDKKVQVHIRGIFDTKHVNQNTTSQDRNERIGTWVYWRME